jgi:two-component system cell cycle response regulator DivK
MERVRRVLVVDDQESWRQTCAEYLGYYGFRVETAASGAEGLDRALAQPPDLVIMDLAMPDLDGFETTRRLKGDTRTRHLPVVALTGYATDSTDAEARAAGCAAVLRKPVSPRTLLHTVLQHLNPALGSRRE